MNPLHWEDAVQRHLDPNHQTGVNNNMENSSRTNNWVTYCQYSRSTLDEPQSSMGVNVGWKGLSPPQHNFYIKESEVEDPDGEPLQMEDEDPELTRKRNELRQIEEQILCKKVAIALKRVEPFVKETRPVFSCNEQPATCKGATLKDRVNVILQQRRPGSFLSTVRSPERMNSSRLSRDGLLQGDHPLKLRVKALMKHRCSEPCVLPKREPSDVPPPPPRRSVPSPTEEENSTNQGFQRFLSVLNKGVDMDLLSRIVNDDSEDLPLNEELVNIQAPAAENKSDPPFRSKRQRSNSGASLPGRSRTNSGERKTDPPSQERSLSERDSLPDDDEKKSDDRGDRRFGSSSRSKSPSAVKKKKEEQEEEDEPKVDEQHEQLQNILKTLGLSLEVEEMSKLADRTQERLYGKKHEGMRADSREEQKSLQKGSHKQYRNSSSSSSSSSSSCSRPTSRSFSPSPSRLPRSHSRDSKQQKRTSERSRSRDRSRGRLKCKDGKEAQRHRDRDGKDSTYQHPYPQNQTYPHPHPHPAAFSAFPHYSLSQYNAYDSGTYNAASDSYWTDPQGAIPPSPYPSEYPYPQNTYHHFPDSVVAPHMDYSHHNSLDVNLYVNPDLSKSEGQIGSASGLRCLQVITTKQQPPQSCITQLTKRQRRRRGGKLETIKRSRRARRRRKQERKKQQKVAEKQTVVSVKKGEAAQGKEDDSKAEQSGKEKRQPTEEEIKANLRKKLEAFNQKVKQNLTQPASSLTSQTG